MIIEVYGAKKVDMKPREKILKAFTFKDVPVENAAAFIEETLNCSI